MASYSISSMTAVRVTKSLFIEFVQNIRRDDDISDISKAITEKLDRVSVAPPRSYIFKVHHQLRVVNEKAYEPILLSVGPYHYGKTNLQHMEEHKLRYLNQLIKRREAKGVSRSQQLNTYLRTLKDLEDQARGYYDEAEAEAITVESNKFLEMMLLDGCFITELFHKFSRDEKERDPCLKADWIHHALARDLTLLENQLPFPVLKSIQSMISDEPDHLHLIFGALNYLPTYSHLPICQNNYEKRAALQCISDLAKRPLLPRSTSFKRRSLNPAKLNDIKHLLDLVHKFMLVEETLEMEHRDRGGAHLVKRVVSRTCTNNRRKKFRYSAVELRDSGVAFMRAEKGKFHDIRFENGILKIPPIWITDSTETLFRNLIAYEEHSPGQGDGVKYISDYVAFLDSLINSPTHVELLRHKGIIDNLMGDDEAVSVMLNKMNKNTVITSNFYYEEIISSLTVHCQKNRNVWMAKLKRKYLNSPWAILSIVAGFLLLIMHVIQAVFAVLTYCYKW